ncbi:uncharacterized protein LOC111368268 [Olea europaea var. sylvestris]|uniref:uncharacterized protein LOC111368268 n=1 Tax=Olea europaea var. sylvestris TaxID=158386 RepID=UPI000C1D3DD5|nr:uncharacterized protein LOC111368268 [Olea europaea var. sylvestris]
MDGNSTINGTHIPAMWVERSAHDSKVLSDTLTRRNGLKVPQGIHYHLQDFAGQDRDPENTEELFNLRHASLGNVVERIFGIFKSRFIIFKIAPPFTYRTQAGELILACVGLHNFLLKECHSDEFPIESNNEDSSYSSINKRKDFGPFFEDQKQKRENANA